jgi:hypothetical protein
VQWQCLVVQSKPDVFLPQVSAANGLRTAVQQHALPGADAAACLLPLAISNVALKDKAEEVRRAVGCKSLTESIMHYSTTSY